MTRKATSVRVGDKIKEKVNVGRYQRILYAGASGDFNPIHIDPDFARMVGLGGAILHGLCTMAFTVRAHIDWAGSPAALKSVKVRFSKPVYAEDEIATTAGVVEIEGTRVKTEFSAANQNGVEVITRGVAELELD